MVKDLTDIKESYTLSKDSKDNKKEMKIMHKEAEPMPNESEKVSSPLNKAEKLFNQLKKDYIHKDPNSKRMAVIQTLGMALAKYEGDEEKASASEIINLLKQLAKHMEERDSKRLIHTRAKIDLSGSTLKKIIECIDSIRPPLPENIKKNFESMIKDLTGINERYTQAKDNKKASAVLCAILELKALDWSGPQKESKEETQKILVELGGRISSKEDSSKHFLFFNKKDSLEETHKKIINTFVEEFSPSFNSSQRYGKV